MSYTQFARLRVELGTPIYECNKICKCDQDCTNRVVQKGRKVQYNLYARRILDFTCMPLLASILSSKGQIMHLSNIKRMWLGCKSPRTYQKRLICSGICRRSNNKRRSRGKRKNLR